MLASSCRQSSTAMQLVSFLLSKLLMIVAVFLFTAYTAACLFLLFAQNRFIFFPSQTITTTPEAYQLPYQDVWLAVPGPSGKIERVHGWWIPAVSTSADTVLYLHGNGLNVSANVEHAHRWHQLGLSVLLIDYRGYGRSVGDFPTESQVYQDVEAAWVHLVQERGIQPSRIFVYGHSLGGAIAIELALRHPEIAGLIVEGTFTSARAMVDFQGRYWMFPVDLLLTQKFDSIRKVPQLKMPLMFIHGTEDTVVPASMTEQLFQLAPEPKQLYLVSQAGHNDVAQVAGADYLQQINRFVNLVKATQP